MSLQLCLLRDLVGKAETKQQTPSWHVPASNEQCERGLQNTSWYYHTPHIVSAACRWIWVSQHKSNEIDASNMVAQRWVVDQIVEIHSQREFSMIYVLLTGLVHSLWSLPKRGCSPVVRHCSLGGEWVLTTGSEGTKECNAMNITNIHFRLCHVTCCSIMWHGFILAILGHLGSLKFWNHGSLKLRLKLLKHPKSLHIISPKQRIQLTQH